jgi:hypothetical protein
LCGTFTRFERSRPRIGTGVTSVGQGLTMFLTAVTNIENIISKVGTPVAGTGKPIATLAMMSAFFEKGIFLVKRNEKKTKKEKDELGFKRNLYR